VGQGSAYYSLVIITFFEIVKFLPQVSKINPTSCVLSPLNIKGNPEK
jgi:hypothetical protein